MRVLVACEFSGVVRDAFRARGHDAVSCDLLPSERAGPHIVGDVRAVLHDGWDLLIAHPPCTFLANSGAKHLYLGCRRENGAAGDRWANLGHAAAFFLDMIRAPIPRIVVEKAQGAPGRAALLDLDGRSDLRVLADCVALEIHEIGVSDEDRNAQVAVVDRHRGEVSCFGPSVATSIRRSGAVQPVSSVETDPLRTA